ncbi:uncharacterized protein CANTADRAFT_88365 [Suhomyces tanzawaensis NRRL Y-17324]|uniref:Ubiquitin-domain-containing protein n=1 Tax=Suhomyces tanzawaensis NRRL Y-17324 TaxID=984487 RepID=A0A1E4SSV2_9ASCO|nr:uncharacterized protein CANTADRAFT_88365 [Suhomyces tanzawaensis NRRL Y-17324]ODV82472.1 hypothetical protein CANTADRAFT_88365 [Suhomyces tanzawaensis NRRL Y-17324]
MSLSITIKSSGGTKYEVSIDPSITVAELKTAVAEKLGIEAERQRLIYSGKVLKDTETVESYKIQDGHTIHLVKSAAASGGALSGAASSSAANSTASSAPSSNAIPSNIAAGTGSFNPLSDLTGARYAGYAQLPSASMFGPDGGMNGMPDPEQMNQMLSSPQFQESMNQMLSNPQMLEFMINLNPQLRAMGPQAREMLQSPFFRQMLANPDMMRGMMEMTRGVGGGAQAPPAFPAPGANPTQQSDSSDSTQSQGTPNTAPANPFASMFPNGAPPINPFALFGEGAGGAAAAPADNRPPEERYESQLRQLNDMGFFDFDRNVEALRRTGGSVQGAIEYLLGGN